MKLCSLSLSVLLALPPTMAGAQTPATAPQAEAPAVPRPRMNIAVVSGEGAINNVRLRQGSELVVQVRDGNRRALPGAKVTFTLPENGPSGHFAGNKRTYETTTASDGRAAARFTPDDVTGTMNVAVAAEAAGETASASITQFNMYVPKQGGGAGKWVAIVGLLGAAAAGGAVVALRSDSKAPGTPAGPPIGVTPGSGTVGAPR
jgi:hypothetical protein